MNTVRLTYQSDKFVFDFTVYLIAIFFFCSLCLFLTKSLTNYYAIANKWTTSRFYCDEIHVHIISLMVFSMIWFFSPTSCVFFITKTKGQKTHNEFDKNYIQPQTIGDSFITYFNDILLFFFPIECLRRASYSTFVNNITTLHIVCNVMKMISIFYVSISSFLNEIFLELHKIFRNYLLKNLSYKIDIENQYSKAFFLILIKITSLSYFDEPADKSLIFYTGTIDMQWSYCYCQQGS